MKTFWLEVLGKKEIDDGKLKNANAKHDDENDVW